MCVFDITLKCVIVLWFFARKYNLLYICCLICQSAEPVCSTFELRQTQLPSTIITSTAYVTSKEKTNSTVNEIIVTGLFQNYLQKYLHCCWNHLSDHTVHVFPNWRHSVQIATLLMIGHALLSTNFQHPSASLAELV